MKNQVQLICYVDRLCAGNLKDLYSLIKGPFLGLFGGVHILPFYYPIDGADAGFDPIDHTQVDPGLGNWEDIKELSFEVDIMADLIVNHMSAKSPQFYDFNRYGENSEYSDLFLRFKTVFPDGATEEDLMKIYRPRPGLPFTYEQLKTGKKVLLWTTFTSEQIDINVTSEQGKNYLISILHNFQKAGISMIRLDAAGYAIKKAGTSSFMIPETFKFISEIGNYADSLGMEVLVEIHSHYLTQIEIAKKVGWVYDFALPPLVLHAFFFQTAKYLKQWFEICPRNAISVLDTHDGIGIIDIGPGFHDGEKQAGLVPDDELDQMVELVHKNSNEQSRRATGVAASNLDLYQVNCTYFDALGADERKYLLARAIQFFAPGIPQVYYMGLLCSQNDMALLKKTNVGRDINRHYYTQEEVENQLNTEVVHQLLKLIRFRNTHPSFQGDFQLLSSQDHELKIERSSGDNRSELTINFLDLSYSIRFTVGNEYDNLVLH